jgi:hypothetical protein
MARLCGLRAAPHHEAAAEQTNDRLPIHADQKRLVLSASTEHHKSFRAHAGALVFDLVRNVSSDKAAVTGVNDAGFLPIDFERQLSFGDEQKLLCPRMQMPRGHRSWTKIGANDDGIPAPLAPDRRDPCARVG